MRQEKGKEAQKQRFEERRAFAVITLTTQEGAHDKHIPDRLG